MIDETYHEHFHLRASRSFCNSSILLSFLSSSDFAVLYRMPIFFLRSSFSASNLLICSCSLEMSGRLGSVEAGLGSKDDAVCFRGIGFAAAKLRSPYRSSSFMVSFMAMVGRQIAIGPERCLWYYDVDNNEVCGCFLLPLAKCKKGASKREREHKCNICNWSVTGCNY